jgi:hypothetical protein
MGAVAMRTIATRRNAAVVATTRHAGGIRRHAHSIGLLQPIDRGRLCDVAVVISLANKKGLVAKPLAKPGMNIRGKGANRQGCPGA